MKPYKPKFTESHDEDGYDHKTPGEEFVEAWINGNKTSCAKNLVSAAKSGEHIREYTGTFAMYLEKDDLESLLNMVLDHIS